MKSACAMGSVVYFCNDRTCFSNTIKSAALKIKGYPDIITLTWNFVLNLADSGTDFDVNMHVVVTETSNGEQQMRDKIYS